MEETTTASDSAQLEQVETEIAALQLHVEFLKVHGGAHSKMFRAEKCKELSLQLEQREIFLEKHRVAEAIQKFEQEHPIEFEQCPLCRKDVISVQKIVNGMIGGVLLSCCGNSICRSCFENQEQSGMTFQNCPVCLVETLQHVKDRERLEEERTLCLADKGNVWAQYNIAEQYRRKATDSTSDDEKEEYVWAPWIIAEESSRMTVDASSDDNRKDLEQKALLWYHRAAEQGCTPAEIRLGMIYLNGGTFSIVPQADSHKALQFFEAAANHGDTGAQEQVGLVYFQDVKDMEKAMYWYTLVASRGTYISRIHLGFCFSVGRGGLDKNLERAKYYLESGMAERRVPVTFLGEAQYTLHRVLFGLAEKRYGGTVLHFLPGHNCIFEMVSLLRKAMNNQYDDAETALRLWGEGPGLCVNCMKSQDDLPFPLRRCTQCNLVWYCGKACQKEHWKMGHKTECEKFCAGQT